MASYSDEIKLNVKEAVNHLHAAKNLFFANPLQNLRLEAIPGFHFLRSHGLQ